MQSATDDTENAANTGTTVRGVLNDGLVDRYWESYTPLSVEIGRPNADGTIAWTHLPTNGMPIHVKQSLRSDPGYSIGADGVPRLHEISLAFNVDGLTAAMRDVIQAAQQIGSALSVGFSAGLRIVDWDELRRLCSNTASRDTVMRAKLRRMLRGYRKQSRL
ncbi:hypothetical protein SE17_01140 [Kouleothrix aurantiaca]|uniref:Uncharacterized protein n=1 Tax=Kouleothrix aurantiaca TaxID=186479 RepID=A0A0P9DB00_9CHLR|nr:hypothetical protein SE17_01140 [Kouleothrix aurantiaca]